MELKFFIPEGPKTCFMQGSMIHRASKYNSWYSVIDVNIFSCAYSWKSLMLDAPQISWFVMWPSGRCVCASRGAAEPSLALTLSQFRRVGYRFSSIVLCFLRLCHAHWRDIKLGNWIERHTVDMKARTADNCRVFYNFICEKNQISIKIIV